MAIGVLSGKVVIYGTRNRRCAICYVAEQNNRRPRPHDCRKNWTGSSKAMEPDVAVQLATLAPTELGIQLATNIGDDDAAKIRRDRDAVDYAVRKWSDISHAKRALGNRLYGKKSAHRQLSKKVIKYVQKSFTYAVAQNKGDSDSLKIALNAIVPHMYGEHDSCGAWCRFDKENPSAYRHKDLPHHKDLTDPDLKESLEKILHDFSSNANKLAPNGSSQRNESFNTIVCSKSPKSRATTHPVRVKTSGLLRLSFRRMSVRSMSQMSWKGQVFPLDPTLPRTPRSLSVRGSADVSTRVVRSSREDGYS